MHDPKKHCVLSDGSQIQNTTFCKIPYEMSRIGTFVETESNLVVSRAWEKEGFGRYMVSFGHDENVLELDSADGCTF